MIGITPQYRASFPLTSTFFDGITYPQYRVGAPFYYLPEHTWAMGVTYANAGTTINYNLNGIGQAILAPGQAGGNEFWLRHLSPEIRLPQNRWNMNPFSPYPYVNRSYAVSALAVSHQVFRQVEGVLNVQNLLNYYRNNISGRHPTLGRQSTMGLRIRL